MYGNSIDSAHDVDRYLELAARIEWQEHGSVERPRPYVSETASAYALAGASHPGA
ncbi:hypothetical protein [Cryptosporangium sp. NPDC048952]|uniref:hypothetical protein n=1 Tax=Cryptosporangium sp. NPDC048952 TaxID=3363961 RepID=UPI00371D79AF